MRQVALLPVFVAACGLAIHAQPRPVGQAPVFKSTAQLVSLNVTVTNGRQLVTGLGPGDFAVYEDGVQQQIQFFEAREVPLDLILLVDTSSSMRDKMNVVHAAAVGFMKTLREGDRGALVTFGDQVRVAQGLTGDGAALEAAIRGTEARGGTALHNALYIAFSQFGRAARSGEDVRRQAFAVLTDGQDTASLLSFDDVMEQARRTGVTVYTISLRSEFEPNTTRLARQAVDAEFTMRRLAQETGGLAFAADHVRQLNDIYAGIAQELAAQYSLAYAPTNAENDGRFRRIAVRVATRPELRARARSGYLAEAITVAAARPVR